jgi:hypothetical protein
MFFYLGTGGAPVTKVGVGPLLATYAFLCLILGPIVIVLAYAFANLMFTGMDEPGGVFQR